MYCQGYYIKLDIHDFENRKEHYSKKFLEFNSSNLEGIYHLVYLDGTLFIGKDMPENSKDTSHLLGEDAIPENFKDDIRHILDRVDGKSFFEINDKCFHLARLF